MNFFLDERVDEGQQRYQHSVRRPLRWVKLACYSLGSYVLETSRSSGQVAQLVEHVTENHGVAGSIPALATKPTHTITVESRVSRILFRRRDSR